MLWFAEFVTMIMLLLHSTQMVSSSSSTSGSTSSSSGSAVPERHISPRVVTTQYGAIRGFIQALASRTLQPVEVFMGIPYASPPTGKLRFMPPVTAAHWAGVKNALSPGPMCLQKPKDVVGNSSDSHHRSARGSWSSAASNNSSTGGYGVYHRSFKHQSPHNQSEDCLYLNIYVPAMATKSSARLPVIVFIHGELSEYNSGSQYDGSVLASFANVLVVTINYRLGLFGFLPALDGQMRGNFGIMDQVAALHWVQANIEAFQGDKSNITIYGHGTGGAFVNILMLSPIAKGLFHRAIIASGSVLSPGAISHNAAAFTKKLAQQIGCPPEAMQRNSVLVDCLRQKSPEDLLAVQFDVPTYLTAFGPTVDGIVVPNDPGLLMGELSSLYGGYDLMFGVVKNEGYINNELRRWETHGIDLQRRDRILRTLVRNLFTYHLQETFLTLSYEYFENQNQNRVKSSLSLYENLVELVGDALVVAPTIRSGILHSSLHMKSPQRQARTYFYQFQYATESSASTSPLHKLGAAHGDDLAFVFGAPLVQGSLGSFAANNYSKIEMSLSEIVMTYFANFIKYGDPNGPSSAKDEPNKGRQQQERLHWPRFDEEQQQYLSIAMKPKIKDHYHAHRLSYWLHLLPKLHVAGSSASLEHHLLEDFDNMHSYEGRPRTNPLHAKLPSRPLLANRGHQQQQPDGGSGSVTPTHGSNETVLIFDGSINIGLSKTGNINDSVSMMIQQDSYSTVLSVTIAIGCSLLVFNLLIFFIFYRRDKANYQHQQQQQQQNCTANVMDRDSNTCVIETPKDTDPGSESPIKLNAYMGCHSIYAGHPTLTLVSASPLQTASPQQTQLLQTPGKTILTGHMAMVSPAYFGPGSSMDHSTNTLTKSNKVLTVCGTVDFDPTTGHDLNI